ncbi:MAG TPA: hypothetical protein VFC07_06995, partial [Verrucomicrobiae bacterium]|nr:hypothetical protein [Verrucomicrobiae bacterium]
MKHINITLPGLALLLLFGTGCNRATLRIPGASTAFPETAVHYTAKTKLPYRLVVELPVDNRTQHYGDKIAGTKWKACSTDALWGKDAAQLLIQERLVREFSASGRFAEVATNQARAGDVVLKTDIHAFCSQVIGFLFDRVAGITSLQMSMERDGKVLLDKQFEKVVTDADPEYTGSQATFVEQAMRVTMADSLREVIRNTLQQCDTNAVKWSQPNTVPEPTATVIKFDGGAYSAGWEAKTNGATIKEYFSKNESTNTWTTMIALQAHPEAKKVKEVSGPYFEARKSIIALPPKVHPKRKNDSSDVVLELFLGAPGKTSHLEFALVRFVETDSGVYVVAY